MKKLKDALQDIISYKHVPKVKEDGTSHVINQNSQPFGVHTVPIGDPLKVSTKGGRKKGATKDHRTTKNGRPLGYDEEPTVRLCSICKLPGHKKTTCPLNPK